MTLQNLRTLELGEAKLLRLVYRLDEARQEALWAGDQPAYQTAEECKSSILALVSAIREDLRYAKKAIRQHHRPEGRLEAKLVHLENFISTNREKNLDEYLEREAA